MKVFADIRCDLLGNFEYHENGDFTLHESATPKRTHSGKMDIENASKIFEAQSHPYCPGWIHFEYEV